MVERAVAGAMEAGRNVRVATEAELGESPFSTTTGANGGTLNLAAVWLDDDPTGAQPVRIPVAPGLTLTEGKAVRIVKDRLDGPWTWIVFQLP